MGMSQPMGMDEMAGLDMGYGLGSVLWEMVVINGGFTTILIRG